VLVSAAKPDSCAKLLITMAPALRDFTVQAAQRLVFLILYHLRLAACACLVNTVQPAQLLPRFVRLAFIAKTTVFRNKLINAVVDIIVLLWAQPHLRTQYVLLAPTVHQEVQPILCVQLVLIP
jgi:hypothetical protein